MNSASPDKGAPSKYQRWVGALPEHRSNRLMLLRLFTLTNFSRIKVSRIDSGHPSFLMVLLNRIFASLPSDDDIWEPPISGYFPTLPGGQKYHH